MIDVPVRGSYRGEAGALLEQSLVGLLAVLEADEDEQWSTWIRQSLDEWRTSGTCARLRGAFGGMGSLNDTGVSGVWLEAAFVALREAAHARSKDAPDEPASVHDEPAQKPQLRWYVCTSCGRRTAGPRERSQSAADAWASWAVPQLVSLGRADEIVAASAGRVHDVPTAPYSAWVDERLVENGVEQGSDSKEPCSQCGSLGRRTWYAPAV